MVKTSEIFTRDPNCLPTLSAILYKDQAFTFGLGLSIGSVVVLVPGTLTKEHLSKIIQVFSLNSSLVTVLECD